MIDYRIKLILSAALLTCFAGCGSGAKKTDSDTETAADGTPMTSGADGSAAKGGSGSASKGAVPTKPVEVSYKLLGQAIRSGDTQTVGDETARILTLNPNDAIALNAVALMYMKRSKPGAAKIVLTRALEKSPNVGALANNLGIILLEEGDTSAAILQFKKALKADPNNVEANGNLGNIYASGADWVRAKPFLALAMKGKSPSIATTTNYGVTLRFDKNYEGAQRAYDDVLNKDSRNVPALLNTAVLYIDYMNKPKEGGDILRKLEILDTDRKDVQAKLNALEKKSKAEVK